MTGREAPVAIVTGAGAGMGRAHAGALAQRGWRVVALDIDHEGISLLKAELADDGLELHDIVTDVTDEMSVQNAFETVLGEIGQIDVLVNNAGAATAATSLQETKLSAWEKDIRLNLTSQFLCIRAVLPCMMARASGSIVNIASSSVFSGITAALYRSKGTANLVPYIAAKAGIVGMTRALAREVGPSGIRVNAVAPGFTPTPRVKAAFPPEAVARMVEDQAFKRVQTADDITGTVVFLASDAARAITGQVIRVDCGGSMG